MQNRFVQKQSGQERSERGYSLLKMLIVLMVLGFALFHGVRIGGAYYTNYKVQHCFELLAASMAKGSSSQARARLEDLFRTQYIYRDDLPDAFYDQLTINADGESLEVSSDYTVTIWLLGSAHADYGESGGIGGTDQHGIIDQLRQKLRIELSFAPYAISPGGADER